MSRTSASPPHGCSTGSASSTGMPAGPERLGIPLPDTVEVSGEPLPRARQGEHRPDGSAARGHVPNSSRPFGAWPLDHTEAEDLLAGGDYGLRITRRDGLSLLTGAGAGSGIPLGEAPTWSDLHRTLIRLRRTRRRFDPDQLEQLSRLLERDIVAPTGVRGRVPAHFVAAVSGDAQLRMHCTTHPGPIPGAGNAEIAPPHPRYPGGTIAATLPALLEPSPELPRGLLAEVVGNRFERRENALSYFLEHFVRPPLRAFRLTMERHRTVLLSLYGPGAAFELSPELAATGRVVVTGRARVRDLSRAGAADIQGAIRALVATIDALSRGFERIHPEETESLRSGEVRAAVDRVIAEELRHLDSRVAEALSCRHPLECFVHTVPAEQDDTLKGVLRTVQEHTRRRRWDPRLPQSAVVVDLDLCATVPLQRTLAAAGSVSGPRPGAPEGIPELANPVALPVLPTHTTTAWRHFLEHSGLQERYPQVNWRRVRTEYVRAFLRSPAGMRTDAVNAGLARFVRDVRDAGGRAVFRTGWPERLRCDLAEVLESAGLQDVELWCVPDGPAGPGTEIRAERLRALEHAEIVAFFGHRAADRIAVRKEFPGAAAVAVEIPGMAAEHSPDEPVPDAAPVIATFETEPWRRAARRAPALSNTHSMEELQVSALRVNRSAQRWGVRLGSAETMSIVESVVADADRAAERTARGAHKKFGAPDSADGQRTPHERTLLALHHVFTRKQFLKGSRSNYRPADMHHDVAEFLRRGDPVEVVLLGFPVKQSLSGLKAAGPLPDLAEFGALVRLRELQQAARRVYPPGLHFNILTDGRHFRPRPASAPGVYSRKLREYAQLAGVHELTRVVEIDTVAAQRFGPGLAEQRAVCYVHYRDAIHRALRGLDITEDPLRTIEIAALRAAEADGPDTAGRTRSPEMFREILMSMVHSVPVPVPAGVDRLAWSRLVYADVYNLTDAGVSPEVRRSRVAVLRRAWHNVVRYLATLRVDEALDYDDLFPNRVRLTVSAVTPGRCGFTYLGGSGLLPWQGTGVLDGRGHVAADFTVSLIDQGFVPAYSPLLGSGQPWMMVPAECTRAPARGARSPGMRLDEEFARRARLRRK